MVGIDDDRTASSSLTVALVEVRLRGARRFGRWLRFGLLGIIEGLMTHGYEAGSPARAIDIWSTVEIRERSDGRVVARIEFDDEQGAAQVSYRSMLADLGRMSRAEFLAEHA